MSTEEAPPVDPHLFALARNWPAMQEQIRRLTAAGTTEIGAWLILTRSPSSMAEIAKVTGQPCQPDEADSRGTGGTAGAGPKGAVAAMLRKLYGSSTELARPFDRRGGGDLPILIVIPEGDSKVILMRGA